MPISDSYSPRGFKWYIAIRLILVIVPILLITGISIIKYNQPRLDNLYDIVRLGNPPRDPLYLKEKVDHHANDHWYELNLGGNRAAVYTTKGVPDIGMWVQIHAEVLHLPMDPQLQCPYDDTWFCVREVSRFEFRWDWQRKLDRWIRKLPF